MPKIQLTDNANLEVTSVQIEDNPLSGLFKYVKNDAVNLVFLPSLIGGLEKPLMSSSTGPLTVNAKVGQKFSLGGSRPEIAVEVGASASVHVAVGPDDDLLDDQRFGRPVDVPPNVAYTSFAIGGSVNGGTDISEGSLTFGIEAGKSVNIEFFRAFAVTESSPTVAEAVGEVLSNYMIPGDIEDLKAMQAGDVSVVSGDGTLKLTVSANLLSAVNPLASVNLPLNKNLSVKAGASVDVSAAFHVSGGYQIRVRKLDDGKVELGYYRESGQQFEIGLAASAGVSATLGKFDLINMLIHAVSKDPEADIEALVNGGLTDAEIKRIEEAIAASLNRNLEVSLAASFSASNASDAAFLYEVDVDYLDTASAAAVRAALDADLRVLTSMETRMTPDGFIGAGVRMIRSRTNDVRKSSLTWKLNLLGILNFASFSEMIQKSEVVYEPITGDLVVNETVSGTRIGIASQPFRADGEKLRKIMFESLLFTSAYRATRTTVLSNFSASFVDFAMHQDSKRSTFAGYLDAFAACDLINLTDRDQILESITGSHPSMFLLRTECDDAACQAMFLDSNGQPRSVEEYERLGRQALVALLPPGVADDPDGLRRATLLDDPLWARMKVAGFANFRNTLPPPRNEGIPLHTIRNDFFLVLDWAKAMHGAAVRLKAIRDFIATADPATLEGNNTFRQKREDLQKFFKKVVAESKRSFSLPWGVTVLYRAAKPKVTVTGVIVSPVFTRFEQRIAEGNVRALKATTLSRETRLLSAEEKARLRPHVVNLRMGDFSTDGQFRMAGEDLDRIFGEELPAELTRAQAEGRKLELMFYAHGGLVDELGGLLPILQRLEFWRKNKIYPIFFVWETGLKETIADIVKSLFTGTRALAIPNALLEKAARPGGLPVWSNMKRSAELASFPAGGASKVAEKTLAFWEEHHDSMRIHACGHSAGAIFHAFFLPALLGPQPRNGAPEIQVETLHLLAPACTTALFKNNLVPLIGADKRIRDLTMYTMHKDFELEDRAGPYHGSLLYLVSRAFEQDQPTPILGLEENIRRDPALLRFFGLAGFGQKKADLLFSKTAVDAGPSASTESTSHGNFDNDVKTMNSVVRRTLDIAEDQPISSFVQEGSRDLFSSPVEGDLPASPQASPVLEVNNAPGRLTRQGRVRRGKRKALCIGIDEYPEPAALGGCVNDARSWGRALTHHGFEVAMLENEQATRSGIVLALSQMVDSALAGDVLIVQYAGHGTEVRDRDGDETRDQALCPIDFATGALLIDDDMRRIFDRLDDVNLTCFMDCCYSGTIVRKVAGISTGNLAPPMGAKARFITASRALNEAHAAFRRASGTRVVNGQPTAVRNKAILFSACRDTEVAFEFKGAGAFTSNATPVILQGIDGLTNAGFRDRVTQAFGPTPRQNPGLDCELEFFTQPFLMPFARVTPQRTAASATT